MVVKAQQKTLMLDSGWEEAEGWAFGREKVSASRT
jgi:hypothetical protein